MGWAALILFALGVGVALWAIVRPGRAVAELILAALLVAVAGYAWQGSPALPGSPAPPRGDRPPPVTGFAEERAGWMAQVGPEAQLLDSADALIGRDDADYAAGILKGAIARQPGSPALWMGLGNALVAFADGMVTPAARYAYERASALAPADPAPAYFLGLAYAQSGDLDNAGRMWRSLLAHAPADAPWRPKVAQKLAMLDRARAGS